MLTLHNQVVFLIFFAIFEFGSLICGVAQSSDMLIVGRAIAGMGGAGLMNGAMTILSACVPLQKRPRKSILLCSMQTKLMNTPQWS